MGRPKKDPNSTTPYRKHSPMTPEQTAKFRAYQKEFMKETYTQVLVRFRKDTDKPILDYLAELKDNGESAADYIRQLILKDLEKQRRKKVRLQMKREAETLESAEVEFEPEAEEEKAIEVFDKERS